MTYAGAILRSKYDDENWSLPRAKRFAYRIKAAICAVFSWQKCPHEHSWQCTTVSVFIERYLSTYSYDYGEGAEWDETAVAHGWRRGTWHLHSFGNGWP